MKHEADPAAAAQLLAALRLASPALPIGGFSYSQGLETAIERGWVGTEADVHDWLHDLLAHGVGRFEAPLVLALCRAVARDDTREAGRLHALHLASRETAELRAETLQMGFSLQRLLQGLPEGRQAVCAAAAWSGTDDESSVGAEDGSWAAAGGHETGADDETGERAIALPLAWARASRAFGLAPEPALAAYLWAWTENQVMAAIKAVPLGQQAGQRLLSALTPVLANVCGAAACLSEDDWSNFAPGLAMAASWHETQYTRIFRS